MAGDTPELRAGREATTPRPLFFWFNDLLAGLEHMETRKMNEKLRRDDVPKKFYNERAEGSPVIAMTVGELKKIIDELPDDIKINQDYSEAGGCQVEIFNMDPLFGSEPHLEFKEVDEW